MFFTSTYYLYHFYWRNFYSIPVLLLLLLCVCVCSFTFRCCSIFRVCFFSLYYFLVVQISSFVYCFYNEKHRLFTYLLFTYLCSLIFVPSFFSFFLNRKKWCVGVLLCILVSWQRRTQCLHNLYKKTEFLKVVCTVFLYFNLRLLLFYVCVSVIHTYMNI